MEGRRKYNLKTTTSTAAKAEKIKSKSNEILKIVIRLWRLLIMSKAVEKKLFLMILFHHPP
jgi:hypothetical protein